MQNAIVGKDCKIGQWSRIDGEPAAMDGDGKKLDITILGKYSPGQRSSWGTVADQLYSTTPQLPMSPLPKRPSFDRESASQHALQSRCLCSLPSLVSPQLYRIAEQDLDVECRRAGPFIERDGIFGHIGGKRSSRAVFCCCDRTKADYTYRSRWADFDRKSSPRAGDQLVTVLDYKLPSCDVQCGLTGDRFIFHTFLSVRVVQLLCLALIQITLRTVDGASCEFA